MKQLILSFFLLIAGISVSQEFPPIISAVLISDLPKVKTLIVEGADVDAVDPNQKSSVRYAIEKGNLPILKVLIEAGAQDRTGLYESVRLNNTEVSKYLIEQNFHLGQSVLYAAENNNLELVKLLAANGAKVDFSQKRRKGFLRKRYVSPIGQAVYHNNLAMATTLLEHGVPLEDAVKIALNYEKNEMVIALSENIDDKSWILIEAFKRSNEPIVRKLIAEGTTVNSEDENGNSMLLIAAEKGDLINVAKCVEDYKLNLSKKNNLGENALMKAASGGFQSVCSYLIEKGIAIDEQNNTGETALFYALGDASRSTFDFLVEKGAKIDHQSLDGNSLLTKAAILDQRKTISYLLDLGADINHQNKENKTAFHYVISNSRGYSNSGHEIQNVFIEAGVDINTPGKNGETLLFENIENGKLDRIMELVSKGADVNTTDQKGERPRCEESEIIQFLIENGADINATDSWNNTYLCEAVKQNDLELMQFLIDKGIDIDKRCYFDEQAIIKAVEVENLDMVQLLTKNGANVNAIGYFQKNVMDYALKTGNSEIISYLRINGAMTKESKNEQYKASIQLESEIKSALIREDLESIISLLSSEKAIFIQKKIVQNIAYVAAKKGYSSMMNKLLSDDIEFSIDSPVNTSNQTALFIAAMYSQDDLVLDLLAKGANLNFLDNKGRKAADFATKNSTQKIFENWSKNQ